jgi:tRNA-specific 2-thiouridylase
MSKQRKALALISGGLDSMLAAKTIMEQGVHVEGINFFTGFCVEGHTHAIRANDKAKPKRNNSLWVAEQLGMKLHIVDVIEEYKDVLINPKYGYGAHMNPCLDCKIFMVNKAKQWLVENDFDFIITGEVIGQRPMSQRKATMPIVSRESGADDLLLRPLCPNGKAGLIGKNCTILPVARANRRWRWPRASVLMIMPNLLAAAVF